MLLIYRHEKVTPEIGRHLPTINPDCEMSIWRIKQRKVLHGLHPLSHCFPKKAIAHRK